MKPILIVLFLGIVVLYSGCIQPQSEPQVKETAVSEEWKADGLVGANEYARTLTLQAPASSGYSGGTLQVSWKNDAEYLFLALNGTTRGWISLGFEPTVWMKDADIIIGTVENERATVLDQNCTGNYGPHENDTLLGGTYDILESAGSEKGGNTVIELKRKMNTGDKFDKAFVPGQKVPIIWAMADTADSNAKHNMAEGEGIMVLEGGSEKAAMSSTATLTVRESEGISFIREEEKVARDLYQSFYEGTALGIFQDTARSEQSHMDSVTVLLDKYSLHDPVKASRGTFVNQTMQETYDRLLTQGKTSADDSLKAAATFEEISIVDLETQIAITDKADIKTIYEGLLAGSEKHLRSYVSALTERKVKYTPQHLISQEYDRIVMLP